MTQLEMLELLYRVQQESPFIHKLLVCVTKAIIAESASLSRPKIREE